MAKCRDHHGDDEQARQEGRDVGKPLRPVEAAPARDAATQVARVIQRTLPVDVDGLAGTRTCLDAHAHGALRRIDGDAPDPPARGVAKVGEHVAIVRSGDAAAHAA